jgi:antirestriction protein ArdC
MKMRDLYQEVTDRIVASLEAGVPPWVKPWSGDPDPLPLNASTRRPYRGVNVLLLQLESFARGYPRNGWLTFREATELGGHVRKGEHGSTVVFFKMHEVPSDSAAADQAATRRIPMLRAYTVFNVAQVEGLPAELEQPAAPPAWSPRDEAETLLKASGATIRHGGSRAYYSPSEDLIQLPEPGLFEGQGSYYATALHETIHATGHEKRCNRQLGKRFGDDAYAMEELIAEIGSAFLCAHCRIDGRLQHESYIASWLKALRNDKRAVFTAAAKAQQAADFLGVLGGTKEGPCHAVTH